MITQKRTKKRKDLTMNNTTKDFSVDYSALLNEAISKEGMISTCFHKFHNYSIHNQLLAMWQLHAKGYSISPLNTFNRWKALGRSVKKGEKALYLWMPIGGYFKYVEDTETKEPKKIYIPQRFTYTNKWFSLEQTHGKDLEVKDNEKIDFKFERVYAHFEIKIIPFEKFNGNIQGYARVASRELAINPMAEDVEMTVLHELAHIILGHGDKRKDLSHELMEVEAETVAYIVGSIIEANDDELARSRGYIQGFLKDNEIPEKSAKKILSVANDIVKVGLGKKETDNKGE